MIKLKSLIRESFKDESGKDWLKRHNAMFDGGGRLIAYHGTSPNKVNLIKQDGFRIGSYFTLRKEYAKHWGVVVLRVYLPLDSVDYVGSDLVAVRQIKFDEVNRPVDLSETTLVEKMSYNDLFKLSDSGRKSRSGTVKTRSIPVSLEDGQESWNFRYRSDPSKTSNDSEFIKRKPFQGSIKFFKEVQDRDNENAADLPCQVDCSCPDFMYRFAWNDAAQDASQIGPKSLNKCINQRPKSAYDEGPGLCKHLIALSSYLKTKINQTQKSNLFEAMSDVAKNNRNFNIDYCDER